MRNLVRPLLAASCLVALAATPALARPVHRGHRPAATADPVAAAIANPLRTADDRAADPARKPAETLRFAGVRRGMVVGEFYPGKGYFTRLLSRTVGPAGHVYVMENARWTKEGQPSPALAGTGPNVNATVAPFGTVSFPHKLDMAWISQNYHDLEIAKYGPVDLATFNGAVFKALKPGGVFLVIDHSAPGADAAAIEKLHRIDKAQVIREVTAAGFRLAGEGDFLANPADDHTREVFDPAIRGHTDQFVLRFVKP